MLVFDMIELLPFILLSEINNLDEIRLFLQWTVITYMHMTENICMLIKHANDMLF